MKALFFCGFAFLVVQSLADDVCKNYSISCENVALFELAIDSIYNLNFDGADSLTKKLESELPDYPGSHLLRVYYLLWKNRPVLDGDSTFEAFLQVTELVLTKTEMMLEKDELDDEAIFYAISVYAILARIYVDSGHNWKAIRQAKKAYRFLKVGMDMVDGYPDLNLYCGIYNYYREKYPEDNPFVRPFVAFFMIGSKSKGLQMLDSGAVQGLFTKVECLTYLYHINLRYEFSPGTSICAVRKLNNLYPDNENFIALLIENLIYLNEFAEMDSLICRVETSRMPYYKYVGKIYRGLYMELHIGDLITAKKIYLDAMQIGDTYQVTSPHYKSLNLLGIGRTCMKLEEKDKAEKYLKKSSKISDYSFVRDEAKRLLDQL